MPRDDDYDDDDPRPRKRRPREDDEDESDRGVRPGSPRKGRPRDEEEDEEDRPRRRSRSREDEDEEDDRPRRRRRSSDKSGLLTAHAIVSMVLGGLNALGGVCGCIGLVFVGGLFAAVGGAAQQQGGMPPGFGQQMAAVGGLVMALLIIAIVISLIEAAGLLAAGYGVIKRRSWGRTLSMIMAVVVVLGSLVSVGANFGGGSRGGGSHLTGFGGLLLAVGYCVFTFIVMLNEDAAREFH